MESMDQLLEEWHETKSISVASEICERLWQASNWRIQNGRNSKARPETVKMREEDGDV